MRGVNKVIIVGTLGADPEIKYAANGNCIANLSVVTSEEWNDKNTGQKQQKTEWHRVSIFGKLAEIAGQYLKKGAQVYLEGKLQTRKWQDQNGNDRYTTEVVLSGFDSNMQMLGGARDNHQPQANNDFANSFNQPPQNQGMQHAPQQNSARQNAFNQMGNPYQQGAAQQPMPQPAPGMPRDFDDDDVPFSLKATSPELFMLI